LIRNSTAGYLMRSTGRCQHCTTICLLSLPRCEYHDGVIHSFNATHGSVYFHVAHYRHFTMLAKYIPFDIYG
jgi:hypothetical protein